VNLSARLSRHAPSAHRFDFMVVVCVIGILATWLLHSLNSAQDDIEKVIQETELNNLRLSIDEAWVHKSEYIAKYGCIGRQQPNAIDNGKA
jgi:hypothetical protein